MFEVDGSNRDVYRSEKLLISALAVAATCDALYTITLDHRMVILLRLYKVGGRRIVYVWTVTDKGTPKYSKKNALSLSLFPQQTRHKLVWDETGISMVKDRRLALWAVT